MIEGLREVCAGLPGVTEAYLLRCAVTYADGAEEEQVGLRLVAPPLPTEPTPPEHWAALAETIAAVHRAANDLAYPLGEVGYVAEAGLPITRKRGLRVL